MSILSEMTIVTVEEIIRFRTEALTMETKFKRISLFQTQLISAIEEFGKAIKSPIEIKETFLGARLFLILEEAQKEYENVRRANIDCVDWYNQIREDHKILEAENKQLKDQIKFLEDNILYEPVDSV